MSALSILLERLEKAGLDKKHVKRRFPKWWNASCIDSPSAFAELKIILCRKLGLDFKSVFNEASEIKFKNMNRIEKCKCCNLIPKPAPMDYCLECANDIIENIENYNPEEFENCLMQTRKRLGIQIKVE